MLKKTLFTLLIAILLCSHAYTFGKNKVNYEQYNWKKLKTMHFEIHYPEGMDELGIFASSIANDAYFHIANYFNHELNTVIPIIIYPSTISFYNNNIIPYILGEGTGGFTESLKNRIVVPFNGSYNEFKHVLVHEMVHAFQYNILHADTSGRKLSKFSHGGVPLWIMEGLAEYISSGYDETADMVMRDVLLNEQYVTLRQLTRLQVPNAYLLYKEGQAFFYYLEQTYGKEIIGEMLRDFRDIRDIRQVFKINTGKTFDDIEKEWIRFYKQKYYSLVKNKNFDDDEGIPIIKQKKYSSYFNMNPAFSPDGTKIAFITNRNIYSKIVVATLKNNKIDNIKSIVTGSNNARYEALHFMSNGISWTKDGTGLVFAAQSYGKDIVYIIDAENGSVRKKIELPVRGVLDPSLSDDGAYLAFVGITATGADVFLYSFSDKSLKKITDDRFSERYPRVAPDNSYVLYSSNFNSQNHITDSRYALYKYSLSSAKREKLISDNGNILQAAINRDGTKISYTSNKTGIYNIYTYDTRNGNNEKITNVLSGSFYPNWHPDGKSLAYVSYQNMSYNINLKKLESAYKESENFDSLRHEMKYNHYSYLNNDYYLEDYQTQLSPDFVVFGITGAVNYGVVGFAQMAFSDYFGNHKVILTTNYTSQNNQYDFNIDLAYYYLKQRYDIGVGFFRQKNPFWIYSIADINDIIHNAHAGTLYMQHYGGYLVYSYPFSKFFKGTSRVSSSRYERDYSESSDREDIYANLNKVAVSLSYDNVLWGPLVPYDGFRGRVTCEKAFNLTGQDFSFTNLETDLRKYFFITRGYAFAFRGKGGKIFGNNSDAFKYYLGGFNSLRGYPFLSISGHNMFMFNAEFRFIAIERLQLGFPLYFSLKELGGVLFVDLGSAWSDNYNVYNKETGQLEDLKTDMGFGFRLTLYPFIILKLDFAWAYNLESFDNREILFSLGFEF